MVYKQQLLSIYQLFEPVEDLKYPPILYGRNRYKTFYTKDQFTSS